MDIHKKVLVVFFVIFLLVFYHGKALAAELNLPKTAINPNNYLLYSFKRLFEKAIIFTKFSKEAKVDYYRNLTLTRMAELQVVVDQRSLGEVEKASQRLSYQIGVMSDYVAANKKELSKDQQDVVNTLNSFKGLLANLRDKYPANSSYWMLIQHNINSIALNLEKLK